MSRALSLAGFQVILIGRFWVITEDCSGQNLQFLSIVPKYNTARGLSRGPGRIVEEDTRE